MQIKHSIKSFKAQLINIGTRTIVELSGKVVLNLSITNQLLEKKKKKKELIEEMCRHVLEEN